MYNEDILAAEKSHIKPEPVVGPMLEEIKEPEPIDDVELPALEKVYVPLAEFTGDIPPPQIQLTDNYASYVFPIIAGLFLFTWAAQVNTK